MNTGRNSWYSGWRVLFLLGLKSRILADHHGWGFKTVHHWFFECQCMSFWLCNFLATLQRLIQNCLGELNLTNCLIYFWWCHHLFKNGWRTPQMPCIVFECFREHNLKLKPTKCQFFKNEINYLAHCISRQGICSSKENLKALADFAPPQIYNKIWAFVGLLGHYWQFIKGFACITPPLQKHLSVEGASKKSNTHWRCAGCLQDAYESLSQGPCAVFCWF